MTRKTTQSNRSQDFDLHGFAHKLRQYLQGNISQTDFDAYGAGFGIYRQQNSRFVTVCIKVSDAYLSHEQFVCIENIIKQFSRTDNAVITSNQEIWLRDISLADVSKVLLRLADVGLNSKESLEDPRLFDRNTAKSAKVKTIAGRKKWQDHYLFELDSVS